jgi:GNAT superfamily N-acetyltransferase
VNPPGPRLERLGAHHDLPAFASGNEELDSWLRRHAVAAQQMDSARTFLLVHRGEGAGNRVAGYFSLTMGSALRAEAPPRLVRGLPAYPVGMVLLARLAVDRSEQGKGLGALLLAEASARLLPPASPPLPGSSWSTPSMMRQRSSTPTTASSPLPATRCGSTGG